jgi:uncharacterized membrane protein
VPDPIEIEEENMESSAKIAGHPIHPMLVVFPLGLLATAVGLDLVYVFTDNAVLPQVAFWNMGIGIVTGLLAAVFGAIDWWAIPKGTRAKAVGLWHGLGNVVLVVLFAASWLMRMDAPIHEPSLAGLVLELAAGGLAVVTGWLGGELVDRLGVGVDEGAHLDAPSSLRTPHVTGRAQVTGAR